VPGVSEIVSVDPDPVTVITPDPTTFIFPADGEIAPPEFPVRVFRGPVLVPSRSQVAVVMPALVVNCTNTYSELPT
jgi:hypothetical protein